MALNDRLPVREKLDVSKLAAGTYFFHITINNRAEIIKWIKE